MREARVLKECLEATWLPIIRFATLLPIPSGGRRLRSCARVSPESPPVWATHKRKQKVKKRREAGQINVTSSEKPSWAPQHS